jgi:hypothetical protein
LRLKLIPWQSGARKDPTMSAMAALAAGKEQAIDKLYHLRLRVECTLICNLQSRARTHVVYLPVIVQLCDLLQFCYMISNRNIVLTKTRIPHVQIYVIKRIVAEYSKHEPRSCNKTGVNHTIEQ